MLSKNLKFGVLGAGVLLAASMILAAPALAQNAGEGRLVTVTGEVFINGKPAKVGDVIPAGAKIETSDGGTASAIFGTDSVVHVASASAAIVDSFVGGTVSLSLEKGSVDGVKKTGSNVQGSIIVKTDAAVFELNSGRYIVGKTASGRSGSMSYVAVDGDASLSYSKDTTTGAKAGTKVDLAVGEYVTVRPSANSSSSNVVATPVKTTDNKANEIRPSQGTQPSGETTAKDIAGAIIDPNQPIPGTTNTGAGGANAGVGTRDPAGTSNTGTGSGTGTGTGDTVTGSLPPLGPNTGSGGMGPGTPGSGGLNRDPLQPLPGLTNPNVTVIFEP